ncbi:hypothetical protein CMUS01_15109 [Colletotrichum musicola]|uniref:Uncharacterized protein n=1 Tax=Colletotrichum musicola TaxID=2175873 RepID=A0A8H6IYR0_9PEZI|nr:hypothetical protein CMUS01_15109 [Colletotrichum musicola]
MNNYPQDQQPQAANLNGQDHIGRESATACIQQQQHGDLTFKQFRQASLTAISQILDVARGNRGPLYFKAVQRFFSEVQQAISKMKKQIGETNAPMINANNNAITQAVDVNRAREGYQEADRIAVGQGDETQSLYQLLEEVGNKYDSVAKKIEAMRESGRGVGSVEESEGERELVKNIEAFAQKMKGPIQMEPMEQIQEEMAQMGIKP